MTRPYFSYPNGKGPITPWGRADSREVYSKDVSFYGPPSHGGEGGCGRYFCAEHGGWIGPRGGCKHRFKGAYGVTMCQPIKGDDDTVWCACGFNHSVDDFEVETREEERRG